MNADETPLTPPFAHLCEVGPPSPPSEPGMLVPPMVALPRKPKIHVVYVAGPFRGRDGWAVHENIYRAESLARAVAALGAMPLTPHSIGAHMDGTETAEFWIEGTLELMRRCDAVIFTDDWQRSVGARGEHGEAIRLGLPRFFAIDDLGAWLGGKR